MNRRIALGPFWVAPAVLLLLAAPGNTAPARESRRAVQGSVAPGYEEVREEFARNLRSRGELGGAFAAYVDGEKVVDLWGGRRAPKGAEPWREDTMVVVFSATKGVAAITLAHLHSRGLLDYDAPVARYWPEFAQKGKAEVSVRQLLSHQAGIVLLDQEPDPRDLEGMAEIIARAEPLWTPGDYQGYHAGTIGYCMQVLVHRIDPEHRSLGRYLQEEIATPLGAEFYIGLPDSVDRDRLAVIKPFSPLEALFHLGEMPKGLRKVVFDRKSLFWQSMGKGEVDVNSPAFYAAENPSGSGIGTARGLARIYDSLATGGEELGLGAATLQAIFGPPEEPRLGTLDRVMNTEAAYCLGFQKPDRAGGWFSPSPRAVGFLGASGALAFADPDNRIAMAYVTNRMSPGNQVNDPRERALREAVYRCAARLGPT